VHTSIDEALEAAEMPAAPGVLAEIIPLSETVAPQLMTQRRVLSLATPLICENLLQTLGGAVDNFMVARILSSHPKVVASSVSALRPQLRTSLLGRLVRQ
jgi:hypothetical protein